MDSRADHASAHVRAGVTGRRGGRTKAAPVDPGGRTRPGRARRWIAGLIVAVATGAGTLVAASPASAATCSSAADAHWSTQKSYNYSPGGWCMTDGTSEVVWQSDGNLVWYDIADSHVFWKSDTCTSCTWTDLTGSYRLSFQLDGNIVIYTRSGHVLWAIGQSDNRRSTTTFDWINGEQFNTCGFLNQDTTWILEHRQQDPDPALNIIWHYWTRCH